MHGINAYIFSFLLILLAGADSASDRQSYVRRLQTAPVKHSVRLFISLEYLREDISTGFESKLSGNPFVSHFCKAVNHQVRYLTPSLSCILPARRQVEHKCKRTRRRCLQPSRQTSTRRVQFPTTSVYVNSIFNFYKPANMLLAYLGDQ